MNRKTYIALWTLCFIAGFLLNTVIDLALGIDLSNAVLGALVGATAGTFAMYAHQRRSEEKPKRKNEDFTLGDDGELMESLDSGSLTLDDLIRDYDRSEDE
jgi:hypothetical protein